MARNDSRGSSPAAPRRVLITGASSGIGRACAHLLSDQGAALVLTSRSQEVLNDVADECRARGATQAVAVAGDVADDEAVTAVLNRSVQALGGLDAVIHAAGTLAYGAFTEVPAEVFERVVATNLVGTANVARSALRHFQQSGGGSLVVVSSSLAKAVTPTMSSYCATKWGQYGLIRTLQVEARRTPGINVSMVSPGSVNTPIFDQAGSYSGRIGHPPPPVSSPERIARHALDALDHPRRDRSVGLGNGLMRLGFLLMPDVYDLLVIPMTHLFATRRGGAPTPGNVFAPQPHGEQTHGRWPSVWGFAHEPPPEGTSPPAHPHPDTRHETEPETMSLTRRTIEATPQQLWEILSDGWLYPLWVVGAARMRGVDAAWPAVGAQLHHSVGVWPMLIDDTTQVTQLDPGRSLTLRARGWPAGEATVNITLTAQRDGTLVEIREDAVRGPGTLIPRPVRSPMLDWRNTESLRRLAAIAENRPAQQSAPSQASAQDGGGQ